MILRMRMYDGIIKYVKRVATVREILVNFK